MRPARSGGPFVVASAAGPPDTLYAVGVATALKAEQCDVDFILEELAERGASHLRARRHGALVTLESGPKDEPVRHVRFRRDSVHLWLLECATHTGHWQATGYRDNLDNLIDLLTTELFWVLTSTDNPVETSGTRY